jgi:hypothetical protein
MRGLLLMLVNIGAVLQPKGSEPYEDAVKT